MPVSQRISDAELRQRLEVLCMEGVPEENMLRQIVVPYVQIV